MEYLTLEQVYNRIFKTARMNYAIQYRYSPNDLIRVDRLANIHAVKSTARVWRKQW
jgi:hypothetical protein